ncbi:hypothetical protein CLV30_12859 [Haloactinopolyspora alba]|uniref:Uncharacterized protein n=1 Tax=Haloactinopolyspora alba TaxID=648780 RepID=A0A2P8DF40_9ACTN|nr:hypothetical protein [Haloactinopolyspora alba]PSK95807.1 hypothetical protein CLV30_12859 [Haloactinopolyspora alba]
MRKIITRTATALAGIGLALGVAATAAPAAQANEGGEWVCGPAYVGELPDGTPIYFGYECTWEPDESEPVTQPATVTFATAS